MRARLAFTLVEVLAAAAVVAILAATTVPSLLAFLDNQRVQNAATTLAAIQSAITNSTTGFETKIGNSPGKISQLTQPIAASSATYRNACGGGLGVVTNIYSVAQVTAWTGAGPFYNAVSIQATGDNAGLTLPIGTLADSIARNPPAFSTTVANLLQLRILAVTLEDAKALDLYVDGVSNNAAGQILWGTTAATTPFAFTAGSVNTDGTVEVRYQISTFVSKC